MNDSSKNQQVQDNYYISIAEKKELILSFCRGDKKRNETTKQPKKGVRGES